MSLCLEIGACSDLCVEQQLMKRARENEISQLNS